MKSLYFLAVLMACLALAYCVPLPDHTRMFAEPLTDDCRAIVRKRIAPVLQQVRGSVNAILANVANNLDGLFQHGWSARHLPSSIKPICLPRNGKPVDCNHCLCPRDAPTRRLLDGLFGTLANFGSMSHKQNN